MVAHPCFEVVSCCVDCGTDAVHLLFLFQSTFSTISFPYIPLEVTSKFTTDTIIQNISYLTFSHVPSPSFSFSSPSFLRSAPFALSAICFIPPSQPDVPYKSPNHNTIVHSCFYSLSTFHHTSSCMYKYFLLALAARLARNGQW